MHLLKKITGIFRKKSTVEEPVIIFPALVPAKQFAAFNVEQRMISVMKVGDSGDIKFYRFMKWCIENDPDIHVRLAALKRLPNFKEMDDLSSFLQHLDRTADKSQLEPYLSMTLSRIGLITSDELHLRLNGG